MPHKVLIIKHGALGDLIQITGSLKLIREKYPESKIILLTDVKFDFFTKKIVFIDEIIYERRATFLRLDLWLSIIIKLITGNFDIVIDLQNSDRTSIYYFFLKLLNPKIIWSGNRRGGKYKYQPTDFEQVPIKQRVSNQLKLLNIEGNDDPDITWMISDSMEDIPSENFVILLPGSSMQHKHKRWPAEKFAELAIFLKKQNIASVILGQSVSEGDEIKKIKLLSPDCYDRSDKDLNYLATAASKAVGVIANDSGPAFIAAAAGCPVTWLLSSHTNPKITQLIGSKVNTLKKEDIFEISVEEVKNNLALRH